MRHEGSGNLKHLSPQTIEDDRKQYDPPINEEQVAGNVLHHLHCPRSWRCQHVVRSIGLWNAKIFLVPVVETWSGQRVCLHSPEVALPQLSPPTAWSTTVHCLKSSCIRASTSSIEYGPDSCPAERETASIDLLCPSEHKLEVCACQVDKVVISECIVP